MIVSEKFDARHLDKAQNSCIWLSIVYHLCPQHDLPHPISDAEIMYAEVVASRLSALAKMIGGVIRPANMANACCKPVVIAKTIGKSASRA